MAKVPFTCCKVKDGGDPDEAANMRLSKLISYIKDQSCPLKPVDRNSNFVPGCYEKLLDLYTRWAHVTAHIIREFQFSCKSDGVTDQFVSWSE